MENNCLKALIVDLEYPRYEINEPINIDTILDSFDEYVCSHVIFDVWYRTMGDDISRSPNEYDIVLISTKVGSFNVLEDLLSLFRSKSVIVGGMLATFAHEIILKKHNDIILSMGECECNLNSILHFFIEKNDMEYVKNNLIFHKTSGISFMIAKSIYYQPIKPFDLSLIKKPLTHRALKETLSKNGLVRIEGSRGCPWNHCSFCCVDWRYGCGNWRAFPVDRTVAEIKDLVKQGAKNIYFTDEDFVANRQHFFALFGEIKKLKNRGVIGSDVSFWGSTSVYTLNKFGPKGLDCFLSLCSDCNVDVLFLGIESGCDEQLRRYSKGVTKRNNLNILNALRNIGIHVDVGFIMFDAETDLYEIRENIEFCNSAGLNRTISRLAKPIRIIPHTRMADHYYNTNLLDGDLIEDELIYPFRFKDHKVQVLYDNLNRLHALILDKANKLQSDVRMNNKYNDAEFIDKLLKQRNYELDFIKEFVSLFLENDIDNTILERLLSDVIQNAME